MAPLRVAFAGLAHSHPFTDAANLTALGEQGEDIEIVGVYDSDPRQVEIFHDRFPVPVSVSLEALSQCTADLFIVTARPHEITSFAQTLLAHTSAQLFFNKVVAATATQLSAWTEVVGASSDRVGTSSVLRFAPKLRELADRIAGTEVLGVRVLAQHEISMFLTEDRKWQDDPHQGGGTLVTVGTHAWEMLDRLFPGVTLTGTTSGWLHRSPTSPSLSEEATQLDGYAVTPNGSRVPFAITVTGLPGPEVYAVEVFTTSGTYSVRLSTDDTEHSLGFAELAAELVRNTLKGRPTAPWSTAHTVVENAIHTAQILRAAPKPREAEHTEKSQRND